MGDVGGSSCGKCNTIDSHRERVESSSSDDATDVGFHRLPSHEETNEGGRSRYNSHKSTDGEEEFAEEKTDCDIMKITPKNIFAKIEKGVRDCKNLEKTFKQKYEEIGKMTDDVCSPVMEKAKILFDKIVSETNK